LSRVGKAFLMFETRENMAAFADEAPAEEEEPDVSAIRGIYEKEMGKERQEEKYRDEWWLKGTGRRERERDRGTSEREEGRTSIDIIPSFISKFSWCVSFCLFIFFITRAASCGLLTKVALVPN
jgi:hypothetical protein